MLIRMARPIVCAAALLTSLGLQAQTGTADELRKSIDILSGVLRQSLGLDDSPNLFGINQGQVSSIYLQQQGVVLEVRSPLANRRNRISLGSLAANLETMEFNGNPFDVVVRRGVDGPETMAFVWREQAAGDLASELLARINGIDYSAAINAALRQGTFAIRSMQELGDIDDSRMTQLRGELDTLRQELQARQSDVQDMQARIRAQAEQLQEREIDVQALRAQVDQELATLEERMTVLRDAAAGKLAELQALNSESRERYTQQWLTQVNALETSLYQLLCDYGATLRELPDGEFVTVVLKGLGEVAADGSQPDKIHVFDKTSLQQCQSGAIDVVELRQRVTVYSY